MGRRHAEPIDVRRRDDVPAQFVWRSRLYVVKEVLEHWFESGPWWASALALSTGSDEQASPADDLMLAPIPASPKWAQRAWGEPAPDVGASMGPASIDDGEQEFWRVEAAAGRAASSVSSVSSVSLGSSGIYDLCFLWSQGSWQLVEVHD
jgi:Domain of unknown function (DUF6504)